MNAKQARACRKRALKEAAAKDAWHDIYNSLRWYQRLAAWIFPSKKREYIAWANMNFKKNVKVWTGQVYDQLVVHRADKMKMMRAKAKEARAKMREHLKNENSNLTPIVSDKEDL